MIPDGIRYRRLFRWLPLFDAVALAFSIRQMIVAAVALSVLSCGSWLLNQVIPNRPDSAIAASAGGRAVLNILSQEPWLEGDFLHPWAGLVQSAVVVLWPETPSPARMEAAGTLAWSLAVWSLFGLMLCRLAARRFALQEQGSFRRSVQFGVSRWLNAVVAPLLPTAAALLILSGIFLVLLCSRLPLAGELLAWLASPGIVLASLLCAYLLLAVAIGWPLMIAAIATDDCDGFGGLSRSYSLWTGRIWYFAWCWLVVTLSATLTLLLVRLLALGALVLVRLVTEAVLKGLPLGESLPRLLESEFVLLIQVYGVSLFWTSATIVYSVLRQSIDGMPLENVAPDDDERPPRDPLPVAGLAAMP